MLLKKGGLTLKVKLLGKSHRDGISAKTGKPYNINSLHCVGSARNVEGQAVMVVTVNGAEHPYEALKIGGEYVVEYDATGALVDFAPAPSTGTPNAGGGR